MPKLKLPGGHHGGNKPVRPAPGIPRPSLRPTRRAPDPPSSRRPVRSAPDPPTFTSMVGNRNQNRPLPPTPSQQTYQNAISPQQLNPAPPHRTRPRAPSPTNPPSQPIRGATESETDVDSMNYLRPNHAQGDEHIYDYVYEGRPPARGPPDYRISSNESVASNETALPTLKKGATDSLFDPEDRWYEADTAARRRRQRYGTRALWGTGGLVGGLVSGATWAALMHDDEVENSGGFGTGPGGSGSYTPNPGGSGGYTPTPPPGGSGSYRPPSGGPTQPPQTPGNPYEPIG